MRPTVETVDVVTAACAYVDGHCSREALAAAVAAWRAETARAFAQPASRPDVLTEVRREPEVLTPDAVLDVDDAFDF